MEAAASVAVSQPVFELAFDRVASFPGPARCPLVLRGRAGVQLLTGFQQALGGALGRAGLAHTPPGLYTPHLTLVYDPQQVPMRPIEPPIPWTVRDFVLVRSRIGRGFHEVLARWSLQTAA
jgi:2'-5' RNA ligase